ncbi:hypothetical protein LTS18_009187 [Coniosporium uncinatum]|uniref:Uncharacterized protein n=1 Tax=Coniosporium uncinatum TaxID=93489 RepID=A0ACC3DXI3_9PEZI|nr:hypothetical protein LTS18_009187 [Coniosporium uncinatum]
MTRSFSATLWLAVAVAWSTTVAAVSLPDCQTTAPEQATLDHVRTVLINVSDHLFGLVYATKERAAFVALNTALGVLYTSTFSPSLIRRVALPEAYLSPPGGTGIALTHDGRRVLVTAFGTGIVVVNVARAITGHSNAVVGAIIGSTTAGTTAIEVILSSDDECAFISQEDGTPQTGLNGTIEVFHLNKPTAHGSVSDEHVGSLELMSRFVVGSALSRDGRTLYATSEVRSNTDLRHGMLSVIDVNALRINPSQALITQTNAGCEPVRIIVSSNEKIVWVTARNSNHLLAFDAGKLATHPNGASLASVQVGTSPVGLTFARHESLILTANSNRFQLANTTSSLSVVDVRAALQGKLAVVGEIPTGMLPRGFARSPDGKTILVSDYGSLEVQAIDVSTLPARGGRHGASAWGF